MRKIKFRVWDNEQQEYLDTDILHIKNDGTLLISKRTKIRGVHCCRADAIVKGL